MSATEQPSAGTHELRPKKAWQWILMYPTLLVALVGAVPYYWEEGKNLMTGISRSEREQGDIFMKNYQCFKEGLPQVVETKFNIQVEVLACPNGDVLIVTRKPDSDPVHRWIPLHNQG